MKYQVVITDGAQRDLEEIIEYIEATDSISAANHVLDQLEKQILGLSLYPERGNCPKELVATGMREYREKHFKPYRIIYRIVANRVYVYLVADGRRDMLALLSRRLLR